MIEQTRYIDVGQGKILSLDTDDQGNFIAFTDTQKVITNDHSLIIDIKIHFPIIRRLNNETFLIADSRTKKHVNGYIYHFNGELVGTFLAGDGIEDIIIHNDKIVIAYFDEGTLGGDSPNNDGLAVFNFDRQQEFGVNSSAEQLIISDCYCMCKYGVNRILFYAYPDLKVYELNLDTFTIDSFETPNDFSGASAITIREDTIIFHSSYADRERFFSWDRNTNTVRKFGNCSPGSRGIQDGKFLLFGDSGYTIINPIE